MPEVYYFSAMFIGVGIVSFIMGLREKSRMRRLRRDGITARGRARALDDGDDGIILEATFTDRLGRNFTVTSKGASTSWSSLDGKDIDVLYDPAQPEKARLAVDMEMRQNLSTYIFGLMFIGIGVVALALHCMGFKIMDG